MVECYCHFLWAIKKRVIKPEHIRKYDLVCWCSPSSAAVQQRERLGITSHINQPYVLSDNIKRSFSLSHFKVYFMKSPEEARRKDYSWIIKQVSYLEDLENILVCRLTRDCGESGAIEVEMLKLGILLKLCCWIRQSKNLVNIRN